MIILLPLPEWISTSPCQAQPLRFWPEVTLLWQTRDKDSGHKGTEKSWGLSLSF